MSEQNTPEWMKDELVREIPPEKLELLQELFIEADNRVKKAGPARSNQEMLLTMMPLLKKARERRLSFTPTEMQAAVAAIRKHSSPDELKQIDKIYSTAGKPKQ